MVGGTVICDRAMAELDAAVLENAADGVSVLDCARVVLAEDISPQSACPAGSVCRKANRQKPVTTLT